MELLEEPDCSEAKKSQVGTESANLLEVSIQSLRSSLPTLLLSHPRQWVGFHGTEMFGPGNSGADLIQEGMRKGWQYNGNFVVRCITPEMTEDQFDLGFQGLGED